METIGQSISRMRGVVKAVKADAFITDRFLYSLMMKYAKLYIARMDDQNKIMKFQSLFEPLPCVPLIEVDKVEACCPGIKSGCTIRRTETRLPAIFEGTYGPLFRTVSSLDRSIEVYRTYPAIYTKMTNSTNFKYDKNKYYWFIDGYCYFPNVEWDAVFMEVLPEDSVCLYKCVDDCCVMRQDEPTHIPEKLFAEIENMVKQDLLNTIQIPKEQEADNQSNLRD